MARLIYSMIASLDGYVADERGEFGWAEPDEEVHRFVNDLERPVGTYLFGRRMYEVMAVWDDPGEFAAGPDYIREFGEVWRAADKIVYSTTLEDVPTAGRGSSAASTRTPSAGSRRPPSTISPSAARTSPARRCAPGSSTSCTCSPCRPSSAAARPGCQPGVRLRLDLLDERRFAAGTVYLQYGVRGALDQRPRGE